MASFELQVSFFFLSLIYFSTLTNILQYMQDAIYKMRDMGVMEGATMENGPLVSFFFFFLSCLINSNIYIQILFLFLMAQGRQVTETGPNNASGIVWAISKYIYYLSCLTNTNNYIQILIIFLRASGRRRRRKQAQTMRLVSFGPLVSFFLLFLSCLIDSNNYIQI